MEQNTTQQKKYEEELSIDKKAISETFESCYQQTEYKVHNETQALLDHLSTQYSFPPIRIYQIGPVVDIDNTNCSTIQVLFKSVVTTFNMPMIEGVVDPDYISHSIADYIIYHLYSIDALTELQDLSIIPCDRSFIPVYKDPREDQKKRALAYHIRVAKKDQQTEFNTQAQPGQQTKIALVPKELQEKLTSLETSNKQLLESNKDLQDKFATLMDMYKNQMEAKPVAKKTIRKKKEVKPS